MSPWRTLTSSARAEIRAFRKVHQRMANPLASVWTVLMRAEELVEPPLLPLSGMSPFAADLAGWEKAAALSSPAGESEARARGHAGAERRIYRRAVDEDDAFRVQAVPTVVARPTDMSRLVPSRKFGETSAASRHRLLPPEGSAFPVGTRSQRMVEPTALDQVARLTDALLETSSGTKSSAARQRFSDEDRGDARGSASPSAHLRSGSEPSGGEMPSSRDGDQRTSLLPGHGAPTLPRVSQGERKRPDASGVSGGERHAPSGVEHHWTLEEEHDGPFERYEARHDEPQRSRRTLRSPGQPSDRIKRPLDSAVEFGRAHPTAFGGGSRVEYKDKRRETIEYTGASQVGGSPGKESIFGRESRMDGRDALRPARGSGESDAPVSGALRLLAQLSHELLEPVPTQASSDSAGGPAPWGRAISETESEGIASPVPRRQELLPAARFAPHPVAPFEPTEASSGKSRMDPETVAALLNEILIEQARRHGVDLS